MYEEGQEKGKVCCSVVGLFLDTQDTWRPEWTLANGAVIPWEEAELEQVLHHHHSLKQRRTLVKLGLSKETVVMLLSAILRSNQGRESQEMKY